MKERYIRRVKRALHAPRKIKMEVTRDLEEIFASAMEHGETEQQVIARLGTPKEFADVWPENDYTRGLPVPPGTVAWAMLDTRRGNCSVSVADITEDGFQDYMAQLRQVGFSPDAGTAEAVRGQDYVSIGTLLSDGERALSVSYASGTLTIYISFEKQE